MDQNGADKNIYFLFQHAEETGDGAKECATFMKNTILMKYSLFTICQVSLNTVAVRDGIMHCASKGMRYIYERGSNPC